MTPGLVIFAHGSRVASANAAVETVAAAVARAGGFDLVEAAFLELGQPDLKGAVARLVARGATAILVLPYFLLMGLHLERDLPAIVTHISSQYNGLEIRVAPPLDEHPALVEILLDRARQGLESWDLDKINSNPDSRA